MPFQFCTIFGDVLVGTNNDNSINGLAGHDFIFGHGGNDHVDGGDGNDLIVGILGDPRNNPEFHAAGTDVLIGGDGSDFIITGGGAGNVDGGAGNDQIYAAFGDNAIDGGTGSDWLMLETQWAHPEDWVSSEPGGHVVDLEAGYFTRQHQTALGVFSYTSTITNVEHVVAGWHDIATDTSIISRDFGFEVGVLV